MNKKIKMCIRDSAVTDLAASGASGRLRLAYGVGREVVMVHISLGNLVLVQTVKLLNLRQRSQRTNVADLRLTTGKHAGAVYSRDQVNLCRQRTDLVDRTAVGTLMIL